MEKQSIPKENSNLPPELKIIEPNSERDTRIAKIAIEESHKIQQGAKVNRPLLDEAVEQGWVRKQLHKTLPLSIYCYSTKTEHYGHWTEAEIISRGLVVDDDGEIICNCMPKFFNYNQPETYYSEKLKTQMNQAIKEGQETPGRYYATEKLDGSLIKVVDSSKYGLIVTSKQGFDNKYTAKATELIAKNAYNFEKDMSYSFELIAPMSRVILDYGKQEDLVLISVRTRDGEEQNLENYPEFRRPKEIDIYELDQYLLSEGVEGVVFKIPDDEHPGRDYRVKMKSSRYLELHRARSNSTSKMVWETLKSGKHLSDLKDIPDEFLEGLRLVESELLKEFKEYKKFAEQKVEELFEKRHLTKKDVAMDASLALNGFERNLIFAQYDGKNIDEIIWRQLKPSEKTRINPNNN